MLDFQEHMLVQIKQTMRPLKVQELVAHNVAEDNSTASSSSSHSTEHSKGYILIVHSSIKSSFELAALSGFIPEGPAAVDINFFDAPMRSDLADCLCSHFLNPKTVGLLDY